MKRSNKIIAAAMGMVLLMAAEGNGQDRATRAGGPERAWLGLSIRTLPDTGGDVVVEGVAPRAPAEAAGVRVGDEIVLWQGQEDVAAAIASTPPQVGDTVEIRIRRDGERDRDLRIVAEQRRPFAVGRRPGRRGDIIFRSRDGIPRRFRIDTDSMFFEADSLIAGLRLMLRDSLGPRIEEIEELMARNGFDRFRIDNAFADRAEALEALRGQMPQVRIALERARQQMQDQGLALSIIASRGGVAGAELTSLNEGLAAYFNVESGALVLRVAPETPAARAGLQEGDVIVAAAGESVSDVGDLRRVLAERWDGALELEIVRHGGRQRLSIERAN